MAVVDLVMPKLGESIMEATILKWHKKSGDPVQMDETVLEIATDKVDSEVPSTVEGIIEETFFQVNDIVPIGTVIAKIKTSSEDHASPSQVGAPDTTYKMHEPVPYAESETSQVVSTVTNSMGRSVVNGNRFYSPLVLNIAASEGVSMTELEKIPGTGSEGRVTKKDILQYVYDKKSGRTALGDTRNDSKPQIVTSDRQSGFSTEAAVEESVSNRGQMSAPTVYSGNVEIVEMDRMRKLIAQHMVNSKHTSPHVTSFSESDVTNLVHWRSRIKNEFEKRENEKITLTPLFIEAVVKCIKKYPWLNSSLDGDKLIVKKDINIGMATALPSGNLIVPVIKNADQLNLVGLTKQVNNLANSARNNKLKPDDTAGGTFTITNVGSFGSIMGTPIINQPQVAILALGAIKKRPVVIETAQGDSIAIRHMMIISMSYDHRIIDGALGATFLNAVAKELENFDANREI
ncbi:MAG TPA: dihydrolipoamide acetyltransferase family protein [Flavitalea sp.]|nr:dihydrolipoamide acetyltransferase family protein [Flavitalea sp.]